MQATGDSGLGGLGESDPQRSGATGNGCTQTAWGRNTPQKSLLLSMLHVPTWTPAESTMETTENRPRQTLSTEAQLPLKHSLYDKKPQRNHDYGANFKMDPDFMD